MVEKQWHYVTTKFQVGFWSGLNYHLSSNFSMKLIFEEDWMLTKHWINTIKHHYGVRQSNVQIT